MLIELCDILRQPIKEYGRELLLLTISFPNHGLDERFRTFTSK